MARPLDWCSQTHKRGLLGYLKLLRAVIKAKMVQRRGKKLRQAGVDPQRSAELPDVNGHGVEMTNGANGHAKGGGAGGGKTVKFKA